MVDIVNDSTYRIRRPTDIPALADPNINISSFRDLASYSWLDRPNPSILVPGTPPLWNPPHGLPQLEADTGPRFVDQNADRYPWSPLEPLIRAVLETHPEFDLGAIDIITDRSPLRKLFAFVSHESDDFEFGVQVVGKTALFVRMEKQTRDTIPQGQFQGYRQAFQDEYTEVASSIKETTSHHRIVEYGFGGLRLLVRSAVDAYLKEFALIPSQRFDEQDEEDEDETLVKSMRATALDTAAPSVTKTPEAPGLTIVPGGCKIPHAAVVELTTRAKYGKTPFFLSQKVPDLWISQTPNFIKAAYQNVGTNWSRARSRQSRKAEFVDIDVLSMKEILAKWVAENAETVSAFLTVLRQVVNAARDMKAPSIVSFKKAEDGLFICKATDKTVPVLSGDLREKWFASEGNSKQLGQPSSSGKQKNKA